MEVGDGRVSPAPDALNDESPVCAADDDPDRAARLTPGAGAADEDRERGADLGVDDQMAGVGDP
eukprot:9032853-Alexandrium_andersonii.AAC.1